MPFALIVLSRRPDPRAGLGRRGAGRARLPDDRPRHAHDPDRRPGARLRPGRPTRPGHRVVALLYVMFLVGMALSSLVRRHAAAPTSPTLRLIQVVQGTAVVTLRAEPRRALEAGADGADDRRRARRAAAALRRRAGRLRRPAATPGGCSAVVALGTAAFSMQDVLLEPYGGEILGLSRRRRRRSLTAIWALGRARGLRARGALARRRGRPVPHGRRAGCWSGIVAFSCVILADPMGSAALFFAGAGLIGARRRPLRRRDADGGDDRCRVGGLAGRGLALGAWGAAQATATGVGDRDRRRAARRRRRRRRWRGGSARG